MSGYYLVLRHRNEKWKLKDMLVNAKSVKEAILRSLTSLDDPDRWELEQVWKVGGDA